MSLTFYLQLISTISPTVLVLDARKQLPLIHNQQGSVSVTNIKFLGSITFIIPSVIGEPPLLNTFPVQRHLFNFRQVNNRDVAEIFSTLVQSHCSVLHLRATTLINDIIFCGILTWYVAKNQVISRSVMSFLSDV